jgi:hypothetical protein
MSSVFTFPVQSALEINVAVTGNTAKTIVDATNNLVYVSWFEVNENNGSTPNLTVDIYDGTNARYLGGDGGSTWVARAVAAKQSILFDKGYVIPKGSLLRVTSSDAAGRFHVHGVTVRANV